MDFQPVAAGREIGRGDAGPVPRVRLIETAHEEENGKRRVSRVGIGELMQGAWVEFPVDIHFRFR